MAQNARRSVLAAGISRRGLLARGGALAGSAALLAACASSAGGGTQEAPGLGKEPVTIRWSTWGDAANPFNTTAVPRGLAIFNQKFPNIKVQPEIQNGGSATWAPPLITGWIGGDGVDITGHCCDVSLDFARQGFLLNLEPSLKRDAKAVPTQDYVEWLMKLFNSKDNGQFALPMYTGTIALMFNKKRFQEKGVPLPDESWDWAKYRETGLKLAEPDKSRWAGEDVGAGAHRRFHQNGANLVDPTDDTKALLNSPKALETLEYQRNQIHKDRSVVQIGGPKTPEIITAAKDQYGRINGGHVAMWEGGAFTLTRYTQFLSDDVDWDVTLLPKGPAGRFTLATNDGWSIWKGSKAKDATWELLKFLQSDEWTDIATRVAGQQSARRSHQNKWLTSIKEANPKLANKNLKAFTDGIEKGYARPIEFWRKDTDSKAIYTAAYNKSVRDGDAEVGAEMRTATEQINQLNK